MSERVLIWAQRVEAQRQQKVVLGNIKEAKEFDSVRCNIPKHDNETHKKWKIANTVEQGTCKGSVIHMVKSVENVDAHHIKSVCRSVHKPKMDQRVRKPIN